MSIHKQAVRAAFNNFVMVNQTLVKHFKDANPALLLGYLISEDTYHERERKLDQYGYFYCKTNKLEEKYGFSYKVQDKLIDSLCSAELVKVVVKRIEGSQSISKVKHFKVNYTKVSNLVNNIEDDEVNSLDESIPKDLLEIRTALKTFAEDHRATFQVTEADVKILKIARMHGLNPIIINESIGEKHKRIKGKSVTAKYLLTAFIPNISEFENNPIVKQETPRLILS